MLNKQKSQSCHTKVACEAMVLQNSNCWPIQASNAKARRDRIKDQEAEIEALRKQLDSSKVTFGGRTGGRDLYSAAPQEYLCPITQVLNLLIPCKAHPSSVYFLLNHKNFYEAGLQWLGHAFEAKDFHVFIVIHCQAHTSDLLYSG